MIKLCKIKWERIVIGPTGFMRKARTRMCIHIFKKNCERLLSIKSWGDRISFLKRHTATPKMIVQAWLFIVIFFLILPYPADAQPLTIITDPYPPYGYVKDEEIVGLTVDIIRLLLERTGIDGRFEMYSWARAYEMAQQEKDILIYQLSYSIERERLFQLVGPIFSSSEYFFKLKDRKDVVVKELTDAKKYLVGSVREYFTHRYLLKNGFQEGKNLEITHDENINLKKLSSRRIDLMIMGEIPFYHRVKEMGFNRDDFERTLQVFSDEVYIGFSRQTSQNLVSRFQKALEDIKKDGSHNSILEKYGIPTPVQDKD